MLASALTTKAESSSSTVLVEQARSPLPRSSCVVVKSVVNVVNALLHASSKLVPSCTQTCGTVKESTALTRFRHIEMGHAVLHRSVFMRVYICTVVVHACIIAFMHVRIHVPVKYVFL